MGMSDRCEGGFVGMDIQIFIVPGIGEGSAEGT